MPFTHWNSDREGDIAQAFVNWLVSEKGPIEVKGFKKEGKVLYSGASTKTEMRRRLFDRAVGEAELVGGFDCDELD
jgi:hypothetical protein